MQLLARLSVALFLLIPYLVFVWRIDSWALPATHELTSVFLYTIIQAALSSFAGLALGIWCALGLCYAYSHFSQKVFKFIGLAVLLPNFLPTLFIVISLLGIINPFPFGLLGIVIVHALVFCGFIATVFFTKFNQRLGGVLELSLVEGASFNQLLTSLLLPTVKRDLLNAFVLLFLISFNSFSIPLLVGAVGSPSIEVLSYQKILVEGNLPQAFGLSSLQILLAIIIFALPVTSTARRSSRVSNLSAIGLKSGLAANVLVVFLALFGIAIQFPVGLMEIKSNISFGKELLIPIVGSIMVGLSVGATCFLGLSLIAYSLPHRFFNRLLSSYIAPSTVLIGFGFLLLPTRGVLFAPLAIVFGLVMLLLPSLFRSSLSESLASLGSQLEIAKVFGATWKQTFWYIVFPQVSQDIGILSGYASFWSVGDFALSRIVSGREITLALVVDGLLGSYRLASASVLAVALVIIGICLYLLFKGMGDVLSQKSHTPI